MDGTVCFFPSLFVSYQNLTHLVEVSLVCLFPLPQPITPYGGAMVDRSNNNFTALEAAENHTDAGNGGY